MKIQLYTLFITVSRQKAGKYYDSARKYQKKSLLLAGNLRQHVRRFIVSEEKMINGCFPKAKSDSSPVLRLNNCLSFKWK